jgi:hypothetical protein
MTTPHFVYPSENVIDQREFAINEANKITPQFLQDAEIVFQAEDLSTLWLGPGRTNQAVGTLDEQIEVWDNKGSMTGFVSVDQVLAGDHAFYTPNAINGLPTLRGDGTNTLLRGTPGTAMGTATGGMSVYCIMNVASGVFGEYVHYYDTVSDDIELEQGSNDVGFQRNSSGNQMSVNTLPDATYLFYSADNTGAVAAGDWDVSASTNTSTAMATVVTDLSNTALFTIFGDNTDVSTNCQIAELYVMDRQSTQAEILQFTTYAKAKYNLEKAVA